jgi:hypothetical protein
VKERKRDDASRFLSRFFVVTENAPGIASALRRRRDGLLRSLAVLHGIDPL